MAASRSMVAIVTRSLAEAPVAITLPQWRVLVIVDRYAPLSSGEVAEWMGVHASNATRACDVLVRAGLLERKEDPDDRRRVMLSLTGSGRDLVDALLDHRRQAIAHILQSMPAQERARVAAAMQEFADSAGDAPEPLSSALGWTP